MKKLYTLLFCTELFFIAASNLSAQCIDNYYPDPVVVPLSLFNYRNVLKVDANDHPWIGFRNLGVGIFDGTTWTFYDRSNSGLPGNNILSIAFRGNETWLGTDSGLVKFDGTTWTLFDRSNSGIHDNLVKHLFVDGNDLWIAFGAGVQKFDGINWTFYNQASGLSNDTVTCFAKSGSSVFLGTRNGLSEWDGSSWHVYTISQGAMFGNSIRSLAADGAGTLFVSTGILYYKAGTEIKPVAPEIPLYYSPVRSSQLLRSGNGSVACFQSPVGVSQPRGIMEFNGNPITYTGYKCLPPGYFPAEDTNDVMDFSSTGMIWGISSTAGHLFSVDYLTNSNQDSLPSDYGELNINKVRARLQNDGDLFWDRIGRAQYEVPKTEMKSPIFCHSIWIGGLDAGNNLHMAGQTYRQSGSDFWPGPLDTVTIQTDSLTSAQFDKIWVVDRWQINDFISNFNAGNVTNGSYTIPDVILHWPGNGSMGYGRLLAPFVDVNPDGVYDPYDGEYPLIQGDQMAWWVMNDAFDTHTETGGQSFGLEIRVSAYAYNCPLTADSDSIINYTTFYSYQIINRAAVNYHDVYVGTYTDVDMGNFTDDFIGCDVDHDFGYGYNGDSVDEGVQGYGSMPPVIDIALLGGPRADAMDAIDNNHDGIIDEPGERCMLQHFQYFNNDFTDFGNPEEPSDFYGYLNGHWKDSSVIMYGGNGHSGTDTCRYMFPGASDPTGIGTNNIPHPPWDEITAGNQPADRRFVTSSGPFTLYAGAVEYLDYAVVFSRNVNAVNYPADVLAKNLSDVQKVKGWWTSGIFPNACNTSIGTRDLDLPLQFSVYPNPFENNFEVFLPGNHSKISWEFLDVTGRVLSRGEMATEKTTISMPGLAKGVYLLKLFNDSHAATSMLVRTAGN